MPEPSEPGGVGLVVLQQDASFAGFASSAAPSPTSPLKVGAGRIEGHYSPMMKQDPSLGVWHAADPGVLGLTQLTGYETPENGIDLGESRAFLACVERFLMDSKMRDRGALRYQATASQVPQPNP